MNKEILNKFRELIDNAIKEDESPVGAIVIHNGKIISACHNTRNSTSLTIDHAEIKAISEANKILGDWRLNNCMLYVTMEPCDMCKSVIMESRIDKVFYLIPRLESKKQYNKCEFMQFYPQNIAENEFLQYYKKNLENFWKNKR